MHLGAWIFLGLLPVFVPGLMILYFEYRDIKLSREYLILEDRAQTTERFLWTLLKLKIVSRADITYWTHQDVRWVDKVTYKLKCFKLKRLSTKFLRQREKSLGIILK